MLCSIHCIRHDQNVFIGRHLQSGEKRPSLLVEIQMLIRRTMWCCSDDDDDDRIHLLFLVLQDNQCGIVTNIDIECAVKLVGTNCVLYPVNSKDLQHIWVRDYFTVILNSDTHYPANDHLTKQDRMLFLHKLFLDYAVHFTHNYCVIHRQSLAVWLTVW